MNLTLFQRDDCLCAMTRMPELLAAGVADFDPVWIDGDAALEAIYGARVPVLRREDTRAELGWPFVAAQVRAFLT